MTGWRVHLARLRGLFTRRRTEEFLDAEMRAHLDLLVAQFERDALSPAEARTAARRAFGGTIQIRESHREERSWRFLSQLVRDLGSGWRRALREPRLACAVALTIGLGAGANAAMLDLASQALFRPLAVPRPSEVVALYNVNRATGKYLSASYPDYWDYRHRLSSLQGLAAYLRLPLEWTTSEQLQVLGGEAVTPDFFTTLRVTPLVGTTFDQQKASGGWPLVAMVAENFWREHLAGDPAAVGQSIQLEGFVFTIIGVVPDGVGNENLGWSKPPVVWIPMEAVGTIRPEFADRGVFTTRVIRFAVMIGRLRPGLTIARAQAEADLVASALASEHPDSNAHVGVTVFPAGRAKFWPAYRETVAKSLAAFVAAAGLIFVLAAFNLLNLVGQRSLTRQRELAVRLSLGGSRARIAQQLFVEGAILTLPGFLLALAVAAFLQRAVTVFPALFGAGLSLTPSLSSNAVVMAGAFSLVMAGLLAVPALALGRLNLSAHLKHDQRTMSRSGRSWLRHVPVAAQVIVSAILLAGSFLILRSVLQGEAADWGFDRSHLMQVWLTARPREQPADGRAAVARVADAASALGTIESAAQTAIPLLGGTHQAILVAAASGAPAIEVSQMLIDERFFATTGIRLIRGRGFVETDRAQASRVAVISETLAHRLFGPSGAAERLFLDRGQSAPKPLEIVGVTRDARYTNPWNTGQAVVYRLDNSKSGFIPTLLLRTRLPAPQVLPDLRRLLTRLPDGLILTSVETADDSIERALAPERFAGMLLGAMAGLSILVAAVGLHNALASSIEERRREIAIRIAVGGAPLRVSARILRPSLIWVLASAMAGTLASLTFTPLLSAQAKGVPAHDWVTLVLAGSTLTAGCAAVLARSVARAARTNPSESLRVS